MADRGRGRSRGNRQDEKSRSESQRAPGPSRAVPPTAPSGAWARRPGPSQEHAGPSAPARGQPYTRPTAPTQSGGRATQRLGPRGDGAPGLSAERGAEPMEVEPNVGGGGDVAVLGRGAMRGRRPVGEIFPSRPANLVTKNGTTGNRVMLQANYFKLLATTDWCLYQYRVDFAPEEDRTMVRKGLLKLHKETLGAYIFDGTVLYTSARLPDKLELWSVRQSDDTKIKIDVRLVGDMLRSDHHYIQFFNIIMRKCLDLLKLQLVGRDYYDARAKIEIRDYRLELWPGYITSIRQHESDILMCSEIVHKVMRQQTLLDILNDCYHKNSRDYKRLYVDEVMGAIVLTDYNNNTYRVSDVDFNTTPTSTFRLKSGDEISYKDYYQNKYQIRITNNSQPLLVSRSNPRERRAGQAEEIYLVPELCRITGLTEDMRKDFRMMKALADHTRVNPKARIEKLIMFNRRLRSEQSVVKEFTEWNLALDDKLVNVPARILPNEKIVFGRGKTVPAGARADWTRDMFSLELFTTTKLCKWVVICSNRVRYDMANFVSMLQQSAHGMKCVIEEPKYYEIRDDRSDTYVAAIEEVMSKSQPELIFCVVSNNRSDRYSAIKKKCVIDRPVPSQVFLQKNLTNKGVRSIATKVMVQMNCKLGGAPWSVELPNIKLMVIGFDVCHDTLNKTRDFGAMVASLDRGLTRYYSAVSAHTSGEELSNELSVNIVKALITFRELNKTLPTHIVVYRDGVGDGQIPYVCEHEVEQIKAKLKDLYGDPSLVKMVYVIVTKRINTRLFLNQNNPPPGTVVDDVVTNPLKYDFFIVSQHVTQGTVSPTGYSVISDTIGWSADQVQRITYKLTHMYYNWSGTLRVPAPCQYAHKLAFFVSQYIHRPPTAMSDLLYYL